MLDKNSWNHLVVCKLFVLRIDTWSYNCLLGIIISYLKPYLYKLFDKKIEV